VRIVPRPGTRAYSSLGRASSSNFGSNRKVDVIGASTIRVIIASANRLLRSGLRRILDAAPDIEVIFEAEIDSALLQQSQQLFPDVLVLDLSIARRDTLSTLTRLFKNEKYKLVVIRPGGDLSCVRSMLAAGVLGYVLCNSGEEELLSAIRSVYKGRHFVDPQLSDAMADLLIGQETYALSTHKPRLSRRELQVLAAVARGFTSHEISRQLTVSPKTIETYRSRIYDKLGLKTRADLVGYAIAMGLMVGFATDELKSSRC
jgi:DNA-binding NarL/FixJ family response regulator